MNQEKESTQFFDISSELKAFSDVRREQILFNKLKGVRMEIDNALKSKIQFKREGIIYSVESEKKIREEEKILEQQEAVLGERIKEGIKKQKGKINTIVMNEVDYHKRLESVNREYGEKENLLLKRYSEIETLKEKLLDKKNQLRLLMNCTRSRVDEEGTSALIFGRDKKMEKVDIPKELSLKDSFLLSWKSKLELTS